MHNAVRVIDRFQDLADVDATTFADGGLLWWDTTTGKAQSSAAGSSGYFARSGGGGSPTWFDLFGAANTWTANQRINANLGISTDPGSTKLYIVDEANASFEIDEYNSTDGVIFRCKRARGSLSSPTQLLSGDSIAALRGFGYHSGAAFGGAVASVELVAAQDFTSSAQGSYISLQTTSLGATSRTERWRIDSTGSLFAIADNSYDIGAAGATRPRSAYLGTAIQIGTIPSGNALTSPVLIGDTGGAPITIYESNDNAGNGGALRFHRSGGTLSAPTQTLSGYSLGSLRGAGYTSAGAWTGAGIARIECFAAENFTATATGTYLSLFTTGLGTTTGVERWRLDSTGHLITIADNAYDIGASAASRPRNLYLAGPVITFSSGTGYSVVNSGAVRKLISKITVTYQAFAVAALTTNVLLAQLPAKTRLIAIYADTTIKYIGGAIATAVLSVGDVGNQGFILNHSVFGAAVIKGTADADLGTAINRANAIQGAFTTWGGVNNIYVTLTATGANLNALTQGSTDYYLITEVMP